MPRPPYPILWGWYGWKIWHGFLGSKLVAKVEPIIALLRGGVRGGGWAVKVFLSVRVCVWAHEKLANRGVFNFSCRFAKIVLNLRRVFRREVQQDGYDA